MYFGRDPEDQSRDPKDVSSHDHLIQLHLSAEQDNSIPLHGLTCLQLGVVLLPAAIQSKDQLAAVQVELLT